MRVLIACERSGIVREAFRARGHDAFSCDLVAAEDGSPFHLIGDALEIIRTTQADLVITHPPCTRLANSGVLRLYRGGKKINGIDPVKWAELEQGSRFFAGFLRFKGKLVIENPIMHGHAKRLIEEYSGFEMPRPQVIQPHEFGDPESKATCLWLYGVPELKATNRLKLPECGHWANQTPSGQNKLGPSKERAILRARTYRGIADAMAEQWGGL